MKVEGVGRVEVQWEGQAQFCQFFDGDKCYEIGTRLENPTRSYTVTHGEWWCDTDPTGALITFEVTPKMPPTEPCSCLGHRQSGVKHAAPCCSVPHVEDLTA